MKACVAKLPYAGINRIRFEGSVSTTGIADGTPASWGHWNTLAAITNVCLLRGERIAPDVVAVAKDGQAAVLRILDRHQRTGKWGVSHDDIVSLDACIDLHEQLIELSTPAQMMQAFRDVISRMNAGHVNRLSDVR